MNDNTETTKKDQIESSVPLISVVVPVFNGGADFDRCLDAIFKSDWPEFECIVVDDASSTQLTEHITLRHGARLERRTRQSGPALARNMGVEKARGEIIFFTDADVLLHSDALGKAAAELESDPDLAAVFGSYDDRPGHRSLISRYRNLYHHWTHQTGNEEATTFWTGCGAIRRSVFLEMGGFSADYAKPSIEDIELGYRLRAAGYRIRLLKTMLATHLKRWKFWDMLRTDIFRRGVPWIVLLLRYRSAPADLNLNLRARAAMLSAGLLMASTLLLPFAGHAVALVPALVLILASMFCSRLTRETDPPRSDDWWKSPLALSIALLSSLLALLWARDPWASLPLVLIAVIVWADSGFYRLLANRGGIAFAIAVVPLRILFYIGGILSVLLGFFSWLKKH